MRATIHSSGNSQQSPAKVSKFPGYNYTVYSNHSDHYNAGAIRSKIKAFLSGLELKMG